MYSLDCKYYERSYPTIAKLIENVIESRMNPDYYITKDGVSIGEKAIDHIYF
jgi:hypothetical protein